MPPACFLNAPTDSHDSDVGHWFGMTEREYPDGMTGRDRIPQGYLFRFAPLRSSSAPTEEPRRIFVGAGDPARPTGKCVSLDNAVEDKLDATAAQPPRSEAKNMPPACFLNAPTDSHTSDVGHCLGMTGVSSVVIARWRSRRNDRNGFPHKFKGAARRSFFL